MSSALTNAQPPSLTSWHTLVHLLQSTHLRGYVTTARSALLTLGAVPSMGLANMQLIHPGSMVQKSFHTGKVLRAVFSPFHPLLPWKPRILLLSP